MHSWKILTHRRNYRFSRWGWSQVRGQKLSGLMFLRRLKCVQHCVLIHLVDVEIFNWVSLDASARWKVRSPKSTEYTIFHYHRNVPVQVTTTKLLQFYSPVTMSICQHCERMWRIRNSWMCFYNVQIHFLRGKIPPLPETPRNPDTLLVGLGIYF